MSRAITTIVLILGVTLAGCASKGPVDDLRKATGEGSPEERIARLEKASLSDKKLRGELIRQRELAIAQFLFDGDQLRRQGKLYDAAALYQRAAALDPNGQRPREALRALETEKRHLAAVEAAEKEFKTNDYAGANARLNEVLRENPHQRQARALARRVAEAQMAAKETIAPQLSAALNKPITLEFRDAPLSSVFELIARTAGVNFVFDRDVRADTKVNILVRNNSIDDAIKIILLTNQLERKVLNENTVLIYPNTPAKAKDYQDLIVRSFFLGNSDPKQVLAMLKTILRARDVYIDEKLNLLVMRDTPQAIRLAEKLVNSQDLAEPEVMLELEVLEIAQVNERNLGITFPESVRYGNPATGVTTIPLTSTALSGLRAWVLNPAAIANLKQQDGATRVLANPSIRVKNREKAKIHVGEKVPVITTTSTVNVGVSSSISYLDTGLKLEVEPNVYLDDDIAIKVSLEVSSLGAEVKGNDGTTAFRVNTRTAGTSLRLRDGETQILAGLINDSDRSTTNKVPGLGDLPLLGRLFSNRSENGEKTEVVLLITPRVVRNLIRPDAIDSEVYSGTDTAAGLEPLRLKPTAPGSLSVAPAGISGTGAGARPTSQPNPVAPGAAVPAGTPLDTQGVVVAAPPNVKPGEEFAVSIKVPVSVTQGQMQVAYDWKSFTFVSASVPVQAVPGLVAVLIDSETPVSISAEVVFKVNAAPPGSESQISVDGAQFFDESGELIQLPGGEPVVIKINKANGKQ